MNHPLRIHCDKLFPDDLCLRTLAAEIASLDWRKAKTNGLISANPAPYNLLSNGETGTGWTIPTQILPDDLIAWKKGANGFAELTARGLSLMFDPFVDACLWAVSVKNSNGEGEFPQPTKVLVLTDYYPLKHVIGEMSVLPGKDWAEIATQTFLQARDLGTTGNNLFKALFDRTSIEDVRDEVKSDPEVVSKKLAEYRLLIWNYFPFMRGGYDCEGMNGLPTVGCDWIEYCDGKLWEFLNCVNASKVAFAMNQEVKNVRNGCPNTARQQIDLRYPGSKTLDIHHPRSWTNGKGINEEVNKFRDFLKD